VLTAAGTRRLAKMEFALMAVEAKVLAALDAGERRTLHTLLRQATAGLAEPCTEAPLGDC
jgi:hypothetical protein